MPSKEECGHNRESSMKSHSPSSGQITVGGLLHFLAQVSEFGPQNPAPGLIFGKDLKFELNNGGIRTQRPKVKKNYPRNVEN